MGGFHTQVNICILVTKNFYKVATGFHYKRLGEYLFSVPYFKSSMWYEHSSVEVWRNVSLGEVNLNFIMVLVYLWFVYYM